MKGSLRLVTLAALLITACAAPEQEGGSGSDLIRVHPERGEGGMDAIIQGTVEVDLQLGCVWLSTPDGARHPVVWPEGTSVQEDPFGIVLHDGQVVRDGDLVSGAGGYLPALGAAAAMQPFPQSASKTVMQPFSTRSQSWR